MTLTRMSAVMGSVVRRGQLIFLIVTGVAIAAIVIGISIAASHTNSGS